MYYFEKLPDETVRYLSHFHHLKMETETKRSDCKLPFRQERKACDLLWNISHFCKTCSQIPPWARPGKAQPVPPLRGLYRDRKRRVGEGALLDRLGRRAQREMETDRG